MRAIGFWLESLQDTNRVPPQEVVRPLPDDVRRAVSDYLDQGEVYQAYRGESWCRFSCGRSMGSNELSDGRWFWPEDLGHYVRDHGITLPSDFIDHVLSGTPRIPSSGWVQSRHDHGDWERWCRENAPEAYWQRLSQARERAGAQLRRDLASEVARREREVGVSERPCMHAGCANRALQGMAICASCWVRRESGEMLSVQACNDLHWLMEMYRGPGPRTVEQIIFDVAEHQRDEEYAALYNALRGCELQVPVEIQRTPDESKWGKRYMQRQSVTTTARLVQDSAGAAWMMAMTPSARAGALGDFHGMGWSDLLAKALEFETVAGLVVQSGTSHVMFDKQHVRYILDLERT